MNPTPVTHDRPEWQVLPGSSSELGESPFWSAADGCLVWIDIARRLALRYDTTTGAMDRWSLPAEPGCMAPAVRPGGEPWGWVIALRDGVWHAETFGGPLRLLAPPPYDPAHLRFNDGRADALGRLWVSTLHEPRTEAAAALYCLDLRDGRALPRLERMAGDAVVGNGLAFSPDRTTVYWADTTHHLVRAWDWEPAHNRLSHVRVFHQFRGKPQDWTPDVAAFSDDGSPQARAAALASYSGRPDGAAMDVEGCYWVALYEGARIVRLSPAGTILAEWLMPLLCPTMPCFGGPDLRTLYVTTAAYGRSAAERIALPHSGSVLALRVDVAGLPTAPVICA